MENMRSSDPILAELLSMVTEVNGILKSHMHDHDMNHQALESKLEAMRLEVTFAIDGFPDHNPATHRTFNENYAQRMKDRAEFWQKMTFELGKYGLLGFAGWAAYALWQAFLHGPTK